MELFSASYKTKYALTSELESIYLEKYEYNKFREKYVRNLLSESMTGNVYYTEEDVLKALKRQSFPQFLLLLKRRD